MDAERWDRIEAVFAAALSRPPGERDALIGAEAAGDDELAREVRALVAAHEADPDFLTEPLARVDTLDPEAVPSDAVRLGPYRLVRLLGRGGMGEVHLAVQEGEGFTRSVAVKVIRPGMDSGDVLRRFAVERRILASLKHPNIVPLLDAGVTDDGRPYVVMEHVEGEPIDAWCDRRRLGVEARVRLVRTVCDAVQHAHQALTLHRDIKPANILVTPDGQPRLLDFGVAKITGAEGAEASPETRTRGAMLTPEYASPEQLRGEVVSAATDVHGLGVLLYELLTGTRPHGADSPARPDVERAVLERDPPRPSAAVSDHAAAGRGSDPTRLARRLRGDLDTIVLKALRKEPGRRYPSAAALSEDLGRWLEGRPVRARPDTFRYRTGKYVRRNWIPLGAGAVVVVALLVGTGVTRAQSRRVAVERDKALEVQGFLLEMFGSTGPDQAAGDSVTARQLLDRQAEALATTYPEQPATRADMTTVLAEGYDRLGLLPEAEELAARALELRTGALPADHPDVAASLALLGWIRHEAGRSGEGGELLERAVATWRRVGGHPGELARALNDLGVVRDAAGDYDRAEELYAEALELRRRTYGERHRGFAVTASNLSVIRYRRGDYPGAVDAAGQALEAMRAALGPDHQRSIVIQSNLAAMRSALGDHVGAEAEYRDLFQRQERLQGADHPTTLGVLRSLGVVLASQRKWADAEEVQRRASEGADRVLGPDHPEAALLRVRWGRALNELGRNDPARTTVSGAVPVLERARPDHPDLAEALETLADALEGAAPDSAESLHRRALDIKARRLGQDHPVTGISRIRLADRLRRRGRVEEALGLYRAAETSLAASLPADHPDLHRVRVRTAEALWLLGDARGADSTLGGAVAGTPSGRADPDFVALADSLRRALGRNR